MPARVALFSEEKKWKYKTLHLIEKVWVTSNHSKKKQKKTNFVCDRGPGINSCQELDATKCVLTDKINKGHRQQPFQMKTTQF